jgi:SAM-dependent methyltransferase
MATQPSMGAAQDVRAPVGRSPAASEPAACSICGHDRSTPVAISEDFAGSGGARFQVVRCDDCGLLYVDPRPGGAAPAPPDARPTDLGRFRGGWLRRWLRSSHAAARVLAVEGDDHETSAALLAVARSSWSVHAVRAEALLGAAEGGGAADGEAPGAAAPLPPASFDVALLGGALERTRSPQALLRAVRGLLAPGAKLAVVVHNAQTPEFALFGGRHWGGYGAPRPLHVFTPATLARLAAAAGLEVRALETAADSRTWFASVSNLLVDWRGPAALRRLAQRPPAALRAAVASVAALQAAVGQGAALRALLRRPAVDVAPAGRRP